MTFPAIPDAVAAVIAAVLADQQAGVTPEQLGRLMVQRLREDGWRISAPDAESHGAAFEAA